MLQKSKLCALISCLMLSSSIANAAGEIDSHRVFGDGLFGMHIAPPDTSNGLQPADSGVCRDEYGALRDADMLPDTAATNSASTNVIPSNNQTAYDIVPAEKIAQTGLDAAFAETKPLPLYSTSGFQSPTNTFLGTEHSPNNQSYAGGYGQYGPINNLDLLRAGITSDLRLLGGTGRLNPLGTISNYTRQVVPTEPVPGQPMYTSAPKPMPNQVRPFFPWVPPTPVIVHSPLPTVPQNSAVMVFRTTHSAPPSNVRKQEIVAAARTHIVVKHSIRKHAPSKPSLKDIGTVTGFIRYGDETVTVFGTNGELTETPKDTVVMMLPRQKFEFKENAAMRRRIASITNSSL